MLPPKELAPNGCPAFDGSPVGEVWKGKGEAPKFGVPVPPGIASPAAIDARKGLAAPPPVICGRRPTPRVDLVADAPPKPPVAPVGWLLRKL